jgi:hypothetical protein
LIKAFFLAEALFPPKPMAPALRAGRSVRENSAAIFALFLLIPRAFQLAASSGTFRLVANKRHSSFHKLNYAAVDKKKTGVVITQ